MKLYEHPTTITVTEGNALSPLKELQRMIQRGSFTWPVRMRVTGTSGTACVQIFWDETAWKTVDFVPSIMEFRIVGTGEVHVDFIGTNPNPEGPHL